MIVGENTKRKNGRKRELITKSNTLASKHQKIQFL